jgi:predicted RNA binding protein YcfA (HicA-like mRNA interferase family)
MRSRPIHRKIRRWYFLQLTVRSSRPGSRPQDRQRFQRPVAPRKIRDLIRDLQGAGFQQKAGAGKGSYRKFYHERFPGSVTLSGQDGADAKSYQEKQIKKAIEDIQP